MVEFPKFKNDWSGHYKLRGRKMTRVLRYVPYVTRNDSYYPTPDHARVSSLIFLSCVVTHWYTRVTNNHNKVMHPVYIKHLFYKRFSEEETCSKHQKMGVSSPTWQVKHGAVAKNPSVMQQNLAQLNFEHCLKQNHTYWNYLSIMLELFSLVECSKVTSYKLFFKKKEIDHFQKEIFPDDFCI